LDFIGLRWGNERPRGKGGEKKKNDTRADIRRAERLHVVKKTHAFAKAMRECSILPGRVASTPADLNLTLDGDFQNVHFLPSVSTKATSKQ
jgi:hypothetical protein